MLTQILQNVSGALEGDGQVAVLLLYLVVAVPDGSVVSHGGGLEDHVCMFTVSGHRLEHVLGGDHRYHVHKGRRSDGGRSGDQGDLGAPEHGHTGDGVAHLARGVVGEVAHRVQGLLGGSGGDQNMLPL